MKDMTDEIPNYGCARYRRTNIREYGWSGQVKVAIGRIIGLKTRCGPRLQFKTEWLAIGNRCCDKPHSSSPETRGRWPSAEGLNNNCPLPSASAGIILPLPLIDLLFRASPNRREEVPACFAIGQLVFIESSLRSQQ